MRRVAWAALAASLALASAARAGDRELEILLVNMTPDDASDDAARRCFRQIERRVRRDYTRVTRLGESATLRAVGRDDPRAFMTWPADALAPLRDREPTPLDAIALVDCRPSDRSVDALVLSPTGGAARLRLRHLYLDARRVTWMAERILEHGWIGFLP